MTSILKSPVGLIGLPFLLFFVGADAFAHGVDKNTEFLLSNQGVFKSFKMSTDAI